MGHPASDAEGSAGVADSARLPERVPLTPGSTLSLPDEHEDAY